MVVNHYLNFWFFPNFRGQYPTRGTSTPSTPASINVNGLPEPNLVQGSSTWAPGTINGSRTSLDHRSSVEPRNMEPRTRHSGAGTPQFRNLAGLQFQTNSSRSSLSNLTSQVRFYFNLDGFFKWNQKNQQTSFFSFGDEISLLSYERVIATISK